MNAKLRDRIKNFLKSEEGRVGLKTPLALGIASGSVLLAQTMLAPSAHADLYYCYSNDECSNGQICGRVCSEPEVNGTCLAVWIHKCIDS